MQPGWMWTALLLLGLAWGQPATPLVLQGPTSGLVYQGTEWTLGGVPPVSNPYDPTQANLTVSFTAPNRQTYRIPAFWYQDFDPQTLQPQGTGGWRARFTPTQPGTWQVMAQWENPATQSEVALLEVAAQPNARGFVRIDPHQPRYFSFDNHDLYLPIGLNIAWSTGNVLADYTRWFDQLARNGGNFARIWMASWAFGVEWRDTGLGHYQQRQKQAWLLDQVFQLAQERGIYLMLCLINHGAFSTTVNPEWNQNPYNRANGGFLEEPQAFVTHPMARELFKRRLRYMAARWAWSTQLMAWEWWNEVNWTPIGEGELQAWVREMTPALRQYDPYHHPISSSYSTGSTAPLWQLPELDFAQIHDYTDRDLIPHYATMAAQGRQAAPNKPVLPSELGYGSGAPDLLFVERERVHLHNGLWAAPFQGLAGTGMYWWWDNLVDPQNLWPLLAGVSRFLIDEDLRQLQPQPVTLNRFLEASALGLQNPTRALVWVRSNHYTAASVNRLLAEALLSGQNPASPAPRYPLVRNLTLKLQGLRNGAYTWQWYNPRSTRVVGQKTVQVVGGQLTLEVPALDRDIAGKLISQP